MDLEERIAAAKGRLSHVKTRVTLPSGASHVEEGGEVREEAAKGVGFVVDTKPDLQLAEVTDGLFVGSQDAAADECLLLNAGIGAVVNVAWGVRDFFPQRFAYLHRELLDEPGQDLDAALDETHAFIAAQLSASRQVLVHCNAGYSRAPAVAAAFLIRRDGLTLDRALERIREKRAVKPNEGFMEQLRRVEGRWRKG